MKKMHLACKNSLTDIINLMPTEQDKSLLTIQNLIHTIRGKQVIIDRDLASLYNVETKRLNEQVKRNSERFPEDFMFQLSDEEFNDWKSQFATSNTITMGLRKRPFAFTECGIAMLSSVLHSNTAIQVNINIMRTFVALRQSIAANSNILYRLDSIEVRQMEIKSRQDKTDGLINEIFDSINKVKLPEQGIFYDGQVYEAYTFIADLIRSADTRIILIDNYIDDTVLTLMEKRKNDVSVSIYTNIITRNLQLDITRHDAQYPPISIQIYRNSHDRFLIIDNSVYHIGASIKDLGKKLFGFSLMKSLKASDIIENL